MSRLGQPSENRIPSGLRAWIDFYDELGLTPFIRRSSRAAADMVERLEPTPAALPKVPPSTTEPRLAPVPVGAPLKEAASTLSLFGEVPQRKVGETLADIRADLGDCQRCQLAPHRRNIVFGQGNPRAQLVFVGEGPGAEEDLQGLAFVGRAGRLLTDWVERLGLTRDDVYICNVIKCRPPGNRTPEKDEVETCSPFLLRQLDAIRPRLVCCLGGVALQTLMEKSVSITRLRGRFFDFRGTKLMATFHPAYILRNPNADREVREDLQKIREFLS